MTATVYLIRHAETSYNAMSTNNYSTSLIGGRSPYIELTPRGISQAQALGRHFAGNAITPSYSFRSPTRRTEQTARFCFQAMGLEQQIDIVDDLHEMSQGEWEGRERSIYDTAPVVAELKKYGKDFAAPGGESQNQVSNRMFGWLDSEVFHNEAVYFVFTHGMAISCVLSRILGYESQQETLSRIVPNASYSIITRDKSLLWSATDIIGKTAVS